MLIFGLALLIFSFPLAATLGAITVFLTILFRERRNRSVVPIDHENMITLCVNLARSLGSLGTLTGLFIVILQVIELFGGTP